MKLRITQLKQRLDDYQMPLEEVAARALRLKPGDIRAVRLARKSVDARDKGDVHFKLTLDVETACPVRLPKNAEILPDNTSFRLPERNSQRETAAGNPAHNPSNESNHGLESMARDCVTGSAAANASRHSLDESNHGLESMARDCVAGNAVANASRRGLGESFPELESVAQESVAGRAVANGNGPRPGVAGNAAANASRRCLVVGMGPGGLFAALTLARAGLRPLVVERGRRVEDRERDVAAFWNGGPFNPVSNVQFGEGGAGTFSDGKLNSGIKDPRCRRVLEEMYQAGAPEAILWQAKPHVGTDHLKTMVRGLREKIIRLGGDVRFETRLAELVVEDGRVVAAILEGPDGPYRVDTDAVILAVGHSARDTFEMLYQKGVPMEQKPFAIGARIEHRQQMINRSQYGPAAGHPALGAADYKLSVHLENGRSVYTFCMCPGGQVVAAASETGGTVVNGMSLFARDGENANAALLVNVLPEDFGGDDPLAGVRFQRRWEQAAFRAGGEDYRAPAQRVGDFLRAQPSIRGGNVRPSYRPGVKWGSLDDCLPGFVTDAMRQALPLLDRKLHGFADPDAVLTGVETRSSSPVRIPRDQSCQAAVAGLYPCGEGAGYAGGIMSAAVDGIRCAEAVLERLRQ